MPRYTLCPYYEGERLSRISCEDIYRTLDSEEEKGAWMDAYCDKDWAKCPYAKDLSDAYERYQKGDRRALNEQKEKAMKTEIKSLAVKLGKANKKIERQKKKIDELMAVNQSFCRKSNDDEKRKRMFYDKWRDTQNELAEYENHEAERYYALAKLYEDRIAYLIHTYCDGRLEEKTVKEWAEGKEYALTFDKESEDPVWIVLTREAEEENAEYDDKGIPGVGRDAGEENPEE